MIYKATNTNLKGVKRHGSKPLNFFTLWETKINFEEDEQPTGKSLIAFRFHSSKEFCKMSHKEHSEKHGGLHVRYFIYDGIDKNEAELIEWALNTDQVANDNKTKIKGSKLV
jgi:hypothetical protein